MKTRVVLLLMAWSALVPNISAEKVTEKELTQMAKSMDELVKPERKEVVVGGLASSGVKQRTEALDPAKVAAKAGEVLKVQPAVIQEALKTRKISEIVFGKFLADKKKISLKEFLAQQKEPITAGALKDTGVVLNDVKEAFESLEPELAFLSLDELEGKKK